MKSKKPNLFVFAIFISLLAAACNTGNENFEADVATVVAKTQTAMTQTSPPPIPTMELVGDYQPISEQECSNLNVVLSQQTGYAGIVTSPETFDDYVNEKTGFGCKISMTTTRADANFKQLWEIPPATLESDGWVEDNNYTFPGLLGLVSAYRKGDQLCLTASYVGPIDKSLCPEGEGYFNCIQNLPPEQIRYGFDANCARPVP